MYNNNTEPHSWGYPKASPTLPAPPEIPDASQMIFSGLSLSVLGLYDSKWLYKEENAECGLGGVCGAAPEVPIPGLGSARTVSVLCFSRHRKI